MKYRFTWSEIIVSIIAWGLIVGCTYFLLTEPSQADEFIDGGFGIFNSVGHDRAGTKIIDLGYRTTLGPLTEQVEAGGWIDLVGDGRKSSGFAAYQLGVATDGDVFMRFMTGPAIVTSPDAYLGEVFPEFCEEISFGIKGNNGNTVSLFYKHISDAGITAVNMGRDFAGLSLSIP